MSEMKKSGRRIAVLGGNNAGKTVFVTSLIDNLQNYDPEILKLGDDWRIVDAKITNDGSVEGLERFPQEKYRSVLADDAKWPTKTLAASVARLKVKLQRTKKKWCRKDVVVRKLEIVDIVGERAADFGMVNCNYRKWSMMITNQLAAEGIDWASRLDEGIQNDGDYEKSMLAAYRAVLVELYKGGANASITPSTARITFEGQTLGGKPDDYERDLSKHPIGLEDNEFVPLPEANFKDERFQVLIQKFEKAYEEYKKEIVEPIWSWLKGADDVIYLVDVLGILADGMTAYNAEQALADSCFSHAICNEWRTEESTWKKGLDWIKAMRAGLHFKRLIVIATKADLVSIESRDNMKNLAKKLLEKIVYNSCFDKCDYLYCSAVCTDGHGQECEVPEKWDDSWNAGKYSFGFGRPPIKRYRKDIPPKNMQLGAIAKLILTIK